MRVGRACVCLSCRLQCATTMLTQEVLTPTSEEGEAAPTGWVMAGGDTGRVGGGAWLQVRVGIRRRQWSPHGWL